MAEDARISTALPRHPKTVKLQRRLGERGCWHLVCLFLWVAENRYDGILKGMTDEDIEIAAGWNGENGAFTRMLVEVGFLDGDEGLHTVHDWAEHNPWAANRGKRIEASRRAASQRWEKTRDAEGMRNACEGNAESNADSMPSTQPNSTQEPTQLHEKSKIHAQRFTRPTLKEVAAYCLARGNKVDPQQWFDHYVANGWVVGRTPMRDWKAAVRNWERNNYGSQRQDTKTANKAHQRFANNLTAFATASGANMGPNAVSIGPDQEQNALTGRNPVLDIETGELRRH